MATSMRPARKLWYETERGFWSGDQAKARLAQVWLWLHGEALEPLPLGHYLKQPAVHQRLQVWSQPDLPEPITNALSEVAAAEEAIRLVPFPDNLSTPLSETQRQELNAGLARQYRYDRALRELERAVEDVVAERYVHLSPGDWVRLRDGATGRFSALRGLTAYFFVPSAASNPAQAWQGYCLRIGRIERIAPPPYPPIAAPGYYWLIHAYDGLYQLRRFIQDADLFGVANIGNTLLATRATRSQTPISLLFPYFPRRCSEPRIGHRATYNAILRRNCQERTGVVRTGPADYDLNRD